MKFISKFTLFSFLFVFAATPVLAQKKIFERHQANSGSQSVGEITLSHNRHVLPYLPSDIHSVNEPRGVKCDEQGQPSSDVYGGCLDYISASTHTKWRIRFVQPGAGERVFQIKEKGHLVLHVQFDPKNLPKTLFMSTEASKYARLSGATPQESSSQAKSDCSQFGLDKLMQRISCEAANNSGIGAGINILGK